MSRQVKVKRLSGAIGNQIPDFFQDVYATLLPA